MIRFGRDLNPIRDIAGMKCLLVWRFLNRTRPLRLKLTPNSPWETISGFKLTATRREERQEESFFSPLYQGELTVKNTRNLRRKFRVLFTRPSTSNHFIRSTSLLLLSLLANTVLAIGFPVFSFNSIDAKLSYYTVLLRHSVFHY